MPWVTLSVPLLTTCVTFSRWTYLCELYFLDRANKMHNLLLKCFSTFVFFLKAIEAH